MVDIWRETASIRFGNVDQSERLTLGSIFGFFQEAAISHAEDLGVGHDALKNSGQAWILSRFSVFIERRPMWGEQIQICSWPRGCEKLFALRDYEIRDAEDHTIIQGRAGWLIIDTEKRRPLRVEPFLAPLPANKGIDSFTRTGASAIPVSLSPRDSLSKKTERVASYSDIDHYGHVNNARYIGWIQDATDMQILTNAASMRMDINYLSELLPGDTAEIWTAPLEDSGPGENGDPAYFPRQPGPGFAYEGKRLGSAPGTPQGAVFRAELRTGS